MDTPKLGTLERVDVRQAWSHEAHDFTPWLANNLNRLAAELGIELELEGTEVEVEGLRADIVARDSLNGNRVLIENQLNQADLHHLGQVLAYLAGLEAQVVIWVATGFGDAHLSAIRWLNEHTADPFAFFAVQVSIVQIGNSPLAPVFKVLERPNEWDRQVQQVSQHGDLSEHGKFRRDFWAHFAARWPEPPLRPGYAGGTVWRRVVEEAELRVVQYVGTNTVGTYLAGKWRETPEDFLPRIEPYRKLLWEAFKGEGFLKQENPSCSTLLEIYTRDRSNWDQMADWLDDTRQKYEEILRSGPGAGE